MYQTPAVQALIEIRQKIDEVLTAIERQDELDREQAQDFVRLNHRPGLEDLDWTLAQPIQNDFVFGENETPRETTGMDPLAFDAQRVDLTVGNLEPHCPSLLRTVTVNAYSLGGIVWPNGTEDHLYVTVDDTWIVHHGEYNRETKRGIYYVKEIRPNDMADGGEYEELGHACGLGRALTLDEGLKLCRWVI